MMLRVLAVTGILCATLASVVAMLAYQGEMKLPQAPQVFAPTAETIQRGAYLATAGNCMSCHSTPGGAPYAGGAAIATPFGAVYSSNLTPDARTGIGAWNGERNLLGATNLSRAFAGARLPDGWYAPSLMQADEAGVAHWSKDEIIALLKTGRANRGSTLGPMAEVVFRSTQFLSDEDIGAMATFLQSLPQETVDRTEAKARPDDVNASHGAFIYRKQCADCHGEKGEGREGAFIPLAGNRAVMLDDSANVIRVVLMGGYLPATAGNPRPHGMPPFTHILDDADIAAVTTYIRNAWGNRAPPVSQIDVMRAREQR